MLRRLPTSVTLAAEDVEIFKQLLLDLQEQRKQTDNPNYEKQKEIAVEDGDPDDIFMGRSLIINERKRRREIESRVGILTEEEKAEEEEAAADNSHSEPLFKRVHL